MFGPVLKLVGRLLYWLLGSACTLAFYLCVPIWLPLLAIFTFSDRCPACGFRWMRITGGMETYPPGRGEGTSFVCRRCHRHWWWSHYDRQYSPYRDPEQTT